MFTSKAVRAHDGCTSALEPLESRQLLSTVTTIDANILQAPGAIPTLNSSLVVGSDNNVWFADNAGINRESGGTVTTFAVGSRSAPSGLVEGPDNRLWFIDGRGKIDAIATSGVISYYHISVSAETLSVGGDKLWFSANWADGRHSVVGYFSPDTLVTLFNVPKRSGTTGSMIAGDWQGGAYFPLFESNARTSDTVLGHFTSGGVFSTIDMQRKHFTSITASTDGTVWFSAQRADNSEGVVGRLSSSGRLVETFNHYLTDNLSEGADGTILTDISWSRPPALGVFAATGTYGQYDDLDLANFAGVTATSLYATETTAPQGRPGTGYMSLVLVSFRAAEYIP